MKTIPKAAKAVVREKNFFFGGVHLHLRNAGVGICHFKAWAELFTRTQSRNAQ